MRVVKPRRVALIAAVLLTGCSATSGEVDGSVSAFVGAEHCGWESVEIIRLSADVAPPQTEGDPWVDFVRDTEGVLPQRLVSGEFVASATLPEEAVDTGYETPYGDLWIAPDVPDGAYVLTGDGAVEKWPAGDPGCD